MTDDQDDLAFLGERHPLLDLTVEQVARLTRPEREERVKRLVVESYEIFEHGKTVLVGDKTLAATCILFSGGNDSTTLADIFKDVADYAVHANTGIGIEETRQYVRDVCAEWELPLIEKHPPAGSTYRDLVLDQGFPGPGHHFKMYQRLKERCLRQVKRELVTKPHRERVIFLAGRRRSESQRRNQIPFFQREGSVCWISPIALWHKTDLNTYRLMASNAGAPIPRNEVSDNIHMSGECLCGSFAQKDELEMVQFFYPGTAQEIRELEAEVKHEQWAHRPILLASAAADVRQARRLRLEGAPSGATAVLLNSAREARLKAEKPKYPDHKCKWGWGGNPELLKQAKKRDAEKSKSGVMCSSCDSRSHGGDVIVAA